MAAHPSQTAVNRRTWKNYGEGEIGSRKNDLSHPGAHGLAVSRFPRGDPIIAASNLRQRPIAPRLFRIPTLAAQAPAAGRRGGLR